MADDALMYGRKEVKIGKVTNSALYGLAFTTGGELPPELSGRFTSPDLARKAVEVANRNKKSTKKED